MFHSNENAGNKLLKQLSKINRPLEIEFKEFLKLMNQCDIVEKQNLKRKERRNAHASDTDDDGDDTSKAFQFKNNPFSVFSGIIPGTKWYGVNIHCTLFRIQFSNNLTNKITISLLFNVGAALVT